MSPSPQQYFVGGVLATALREARKAGLAVAEIEQTVEPTTFVLAFVNGIRVRVVVETLP